MPYRPFADQEFRNVVQTGLEIPALLRLLLVPRGAGYYETLFAGAGGLDTQEIAAVSAIIGDHRDIAGDWWTRRASTSPLAAADTDWLGERWNRLRAEVNTKVSPTAAERLQRVFGHHE